MFRLADLVFPFPNLTHLPHFLQPRERLHDNNNNFNFSSIRAEMTGKRFGDKNNLVDFSMKVIALLDPKTVPLSNGHIIAYSIEYKEGNKITRGVLLNKVSYSYDESNGWRIINDSEGWNLLGPLLMCAPILLLNGSSTTIRILPDEQLNGRTVGVLSYQVTNANNNIPVILKAVYRYDKTNLRPLAVRVDSGEVYQEWKVLEYNNPNLKVEAPSGAVKLATPTAAPTTTVPPNK